MKATIALLLSLCSASALLAQKLDVKIVDRKDNETDYSYVVPSSFSSYSNSTARCNGNLDNVNCSDQPQPTDMPPQLIMSHTRCREPHSYSNCRMVGRRS